MRSVWGIVGEAVIGVATLVITIAGYVFLARDIVVLQLPVYILIGLGNVIFLIIGLRAFIRQRKDFQRASDGIKIQAAKDHYSISPEARKERAYRVFYHLHRKGETYRAGSPELQWQ